MLRQIARCCCFPYRQRKHALDGQAYGESWGFGGTTPQGAWLCRPAVPGMVPHSPAIETSPLRAHRGDINSLSITIWHSWVKSSVQSRTGVPRARGTLGSFCSRFPSHLMPSSCSRFARRQQHPASIRHGQRRLRVLDVSPNSSTFCSLPKSGSLPGIREKCHLQPEMGSGWAWNIGHRGEGGSVTPADVLLQISGGFPWK